jgi:hypothetical protein
VRAAKSLNIAMSGTKFSSLIISTSLILASALAAFSQVPERVDVRSLEIHHASSYTDTDITMVVKDSGGVEKTYQGWGTFQVLPLYNCFPCAIPNQFETNLGFHTTQWTNGNT